MRTPGFHRIPEGRSPEAQHEKIVIDNVSLSYYTPEGEVEALAPTSLGIGAGEFISLIGQSGCGKSTLLSIIAGILPPTAGTVLIDGQPSNRPSPKIGYMLQQDYLFEWRTILDNAMLGAEIRGMDLNRARTNAIRLLEKCGLGEFLHKYPRQLSGGMRQRVALARTLCVEPDIVLLDEPFSALDSQTRLSIADEVVDVLRDEKKTVILVTHDIGEAVGMTDRVIVLSRRPGRIKAEYRIDFGNGGNRRPGVLEARNLPAFNTYFNLLWRELDVHVEG
jgi:NitT/TauT family transport system ATP-binding protein